MSMQALAVAFLAFTAVGGLAWVFIYPSLSGQTKVLQRRATTIARSEPSVRQVDKVQRSRREQVEIKPRFRWRPVSYRPDSTGPTRSS